MICFIKSNIRNIILILSILFFSNHAYSLSELFSVEIDENLSEVKTKDLKKLKTRDMERLLFGTASLGFYEDGVIFEDIHFPNSPEEKGEYQTLINQSQEYKGVYKIAGSKICYLIDGTDDWHCVVLYKHKKLGGIYYWAQKGKIFAKIVKVMDIPSYEKMKFDHSEAEKAKREEEKRLAEEKRIADAKAAEEKRIAEEKRKEEEKRLAEEKRIADEKAAEEKRIAAENRIASLQNNFGYKDIKFGMTLKEIKSLKVCDSPTYMFMSANRGGICYDKKNWLFYFSRSGELLNGVIIDLGPYTAEHLHRVRSALGNKYELEFDPCPAEDIVDWFYGCPGREMELFQAGEKDQFSIVYRDGSVVLSIKRVKIDDYNTDYKIYLEYFDEKKSKIMLETLKPQDAVSSDDF